MKKIIILLLIIVMSSAVTVVYYTNNSEQLAFVDKYVDNFKSNLFNLRLKYELKKSQNVEDFSVDENNSDPENDIENENNSLNENNSEDTIVNETNNNAGHSSNVIKDPEKIDNGGIVDDVNLTKEFILKYDPIALKNAGKARYHRYKNGMLCALENSVSLYTKTGEIKWTNSVQISDPILKVSGDYYLLFEKNGTKIAVYNENRLIYSKEFTNKILNGNISSSGDSVVVTEMPYYKGAVIVLNKSGEEIFKRNFGSENVITAAISDSRKLAVSLLSIRTNAYSRIAFFDIDKTDEENSIEYDNTVIYDIDFSSNSLIAYGDNKIMSINSNAKEHWVYEFNEKSLMNFSKDNSNMRLLMFDNNNNAELNVLTYSGNLRPGIPTNVVPSFSDIYDGNIIYNNERNLYLTQLNGATLAKFSASRDIKKAYFIDSDNILVIYNQSLELLSVKKIQEQKNNE